MGRMAKYKLVGDPRRLVDGEELDAGEAADSLLGGVVAGRPSRTGGLFPQPKSKALVREASWRLGS
jgi:hypothetical protein